MTARTMHAVAYDRYGGGASALKVLVPFPRKEEILIKLEATSINPFDWKIQNGKIGPFVPWRFPFVPVSDIAGEVAEIGPGVNKFKVGDKVVAMLTSEIGGGFAEYAVAKQKMIVNRPPEVSAAEGAGLPTTAITALQALTSAGIKLDGSGKQSNILITAASGGVGHHAVQLAKFGNTHVTATCGARNIEFVKSLGADEVLDYRTAEGSALKSPSGKKYDAVIHCTTDIPWSTFEPNLSKNGKVIDLTPTPGALMTFVCQKLAFSKKQLLPLIATLNSEDLEYLVGLVKDGKLKTKIDSKYPLKRQRLHGGRALRAMPLARS